MGKSSHSSQNVAQPTPPVASATAITASRSLTMARSFPFPVGSDPIDDGLPVPSAHRSPATSGRAGAAFPPARQSRQNVRNDHRPPSYRTMSQIRIHPQLPQTNTVAPEPQGSMIDRRQVLYFGGNGHAAIRLSKARQACAEARQSHLCDVLLHSTGSPPRSSATSNAGSPRYPRASPTSPSGGRPRSRDRPGRAADHRGGPGRAPGRWSSSPAGAITR